MKNASAATQAILATGWSRSVKTCGIYRIRNKSSGRVYIGSSIECERRMRIHAWKLEHGKHWSKHLQAAWNKYGAEAFEFKIVETVEDANFLLPREQFWIWRTNAHIDGYNKLERPDRMSGFRHSPETRARMSERMKREFMDGTKRIPRVWTEQARRETTERFSRWRDENKNAYVESKKRAGLKMRSVPRTEEWKRKMAEGNRGKRRTPEQRAAISATSAALWRDPEYRAKMSRALRGLPVSELKKAKHREQMRSFWTTASEEERAKRCAQIREGWARRKAALNAGGKQ